MTHRHHLSCAGSGHPRHTRPSPVWGCACCACSYEACSLPHALPVMCELRVMLGKQTAQRFQSWKPVSAMMSCARHERKGCLDAVLQISAAKSSGGQRDVQRARRYVLSSCGQEIHPLYSFKTLNTAHSTDEERLKKHTQRLHKRTQRTPSLILK